MTWGKIEPEAFSLFNHLNEPGINGIQSKGHGVPYQVVITPLCSAYYLYLLNKYAKKLQVAVYLTISSFIISIHKTAPKTTTNSKRLTEQPLLTCFSEIIHIVSVLKVKVNPKVCKIRGACPRSQCFFNCLALPHSIFFPFSFPWVARLTSYLGWDLHKRLQNFRDFRKQRGEGLTIKDHKQGT